MSKILKYQLTVSITPAGGAGATPVIEVCSSTPIFYQNVKFIQEILECFVYSGVNWFDLLEILLKACTICFSSKVSKNVEISANLKEKNYDSEQEHTPGPPFSQLVRMKKEQSSTSFGT